MILQVNDVVLHLNAHRFDGFAAWQAEFAMVTKKKDGPSVVRAAQRHRVKRFHLPCRTDSWAITIVRISKQNGIVETEANAACQKQHYFAKRRSWITAVITEPGRQSCKQKNTHASPASRASHCYVAITPVRGQTFFLLSLVCLNSFECNRNQQNTRVSL